MLSVFGTFGGSIGFGVALGLTLGLGGSFELLMTIDLVVFGGTLGCVVSATGWLFGVTGGFLLASVGLTEFDGDLK